MARQSKHSRAYATNATLVVDMFVRAQGPRRPAVFPLTRVVADDSEKMRNPSSCRGASDIEFDDRVRIKNKLRHKGWTGIGYVGDQLIS